MWKEREEVSGKLSATPPSQLHSEVMSLHARCHGIQERLKFIVSPDVFGKIHEVRKMAEEEAANGNDCDKEKKKAAGGGDTV